MAKNIVPKIAVEKFFPYAKQSLDKSDLDAVKESLSQVLITRGIKTKEFEEALAQKVSAKYAVTFTSGTTALYAAFQAAEVCAYDRFVTTPNSFIATTAAGMRLGAKPIFVDIDRKNGGMSIEGLKEILKEPMSRGRFVIAPVHFAGIAHDMAAIDRELKGPDYIIIEDAAHAIGSEYPDGTMVGSCTHSHMTVFSFHAIKTVTCAEGGAVTTNDEKLYRRLLTIRNSGIQRDSQFLMHGQNVKDPDMKDQAAPWYYEVQELSSNYHMTEMQAALGLSQLKRLDDFSEKRKQIVSWYRKYLSEVKNLRLFDEAYDSRTCYHLMCVQVDFEAAKKSRTQLMQELHEDAIGTQYHYIPLYRHPAVAKVCGEIQSQFPEMEGYYAQGLSLPLYYELKEEDVKYICGSLKARLEK